MTFDEIPYNWRKPGVYTEVKPRYVRKGLVDFPARAIIVAQMLATGVAEAGKRYPITRDDEGKAYCGAGSVGAEMVKYFRKVNKATELYLVALPDDAAGIAATKTMTLTGSPTYGGPLPLYVEETRIQLALTAAQTVASIATEVAAAVNALDDLPVTATAALGVVTLTAKHKGEVGNHISVRVASEAGDSVPAGLTAVVAADVVGANNPDVDTVLDAISNEWYTDAAFAWDDATNLGKIAADFAARFTAAAKKDAHAYIGCRGTYAELVAKGAITNSPFITPIGAKKARSAPWKWAAVLAGIGAAQLATDPARQLRSLVMTGIGAPDYEDCFTAEEQNLLLGKGMSTWNRLDDGSVVLERVVTTYKVTTLNVDDDAWLDIMVTKTASRIRYDWNAYCDQTYPRNKLAEDDSIAAEHAENVSTPKRLHGSWAGRCQLYARKGWIMQTDRTIGESAFEIDEDDKNVANSRLVINIIGNQMVLKGSLEFEV
ncbi:phage tail sheath subtilisin-like domain-containing protein [Ancylobacter pratisalsi]